MVQEAEPWDSHIQKYKPGILILQGGKKKSKMQEIGHLHTATAAGILEKVGLRRCPPSDMRPEWSGSPLWGSGPPAVPP